MVSTLNHAILHAIVMEQGGLEDRPALASSLRRCGNDKTLVEGKQLHARIQESGQDRETFLGNLLVQMYGKCGSLADAQAAFDRIRYPNVFSCTLLITACIQNGHAKEAIAVFRKMDLEGVQPDMFIFSSVLGACSRVGALAEGKAIHSRIVDSGLELDLPVQNALVGMYAKCGSLDEARRLFDALPRKSVVTWNIMIAANAQKGHPVQALELFKEMVYRGLRVDKFTFANVLGACSCMEELTLVHDHLVAVGCEPDVVVQNALIRMYARCGSLGCARIMFDHMLQRSVGTWNAMISAYAQHGHPSEALQLYRQMDAEPDVFTFVSILASCSDLKSLEDGKLVHAHIQRCGLESQEAQNALVHMYAKCGSLADALGIFDRMQQRDVVSWTAMLAAYAQEGHSQEAFQLYRRMDLEGVKQDAFTFSIILAACSSLGDIAEGDAIHSRVVQSGLDSNGVVQNALFNMFVKYGSLDDARAVFDKMPMKEVDVWTAMVVAYSQQEQPGEALELFQRMVLEGLEPDEISLISLLRACSYWRLWEEGYDYFASIDRDFGIALTEELYVCMVELLGRAGRLSDAEELVNSLPFPAGAAPWTTLLGACRAHGDVERGVRVAKHVLELEFQNALLKS